MIKSRCFMTKLDEKPRDTVETRRRWSAAMRLAQHGENRDVAIEKNKGNRAERRQKIIIILPNFHLVAQGWFLAWVYGPLVGRSS